ncbi:exodeoxyribonuclease III [Polaromonas sp.]|uniref:exodeoxyribonuclease III n=1 Tax=Polaromonas sp. TaxID=1869339 RepID=UPI00352A8CB0
MRIATYNVNDVRKRFKPLSAWLEVTHPDVVCLQELKCTEAAFPHDALRTLGYHALVVGQASWNGVAIMARDAKPVEIRRTLPGDPKDRQARYVEAAVNGVVIGCCYMPNGNPQPGPKFDQKLDWFERFNAHAGELLASGHPVVLAGDYNVVPSDADIYATKSFRSNALLQPGPRAAYQALLDEGWLDALKKQSPEASLFTFWSYMRNRWARDAGMRIDHLLLSPKAAKRFKGAGVDRAVRGLVDTSDHAPAWVEIEN